MNRSVKTFMKITTFAIAGLLISSGLMAQEKQAKPWEVPAEFKSMKNPVASNEASINAGKALYTKHCASCHGKTGLGDGVKARMLKDFAGDFSGAYYQNQTDGEHFYKTKVGRGEMPKYEGKLTDDDIWNMVNYMRTFKK
ncbi:MAG TPA: cytochrome c [Bacteroidales bacterium]|mgnify:CR=1 FL=1|jgi:mono/diheme cytochrome c family protein|nr:cytochrome c [Bacteroidales bacterium]